jgi:type VI secretion system protein VasJ
MLGPIGSTSRWRWAAYGKHPVANDFFKLGDDFSLGKGFSDWVGNGYRAVASKGDVRHGLCSWRFWAGGGQKGVLACGLLRDSSDRVGRPFPLLIIGMGSLKGWEDQWDLLPFACEATWNQIEYLSALVVNDFKKLEVEVNQIRPPQPEWPEFIRLRGDSEEDISDGYIQAKELSGQEESLIPLDQRPSEDQVKQISSWHSLFKAHGRTIPNAVFMGGTMEKAYIAAYRRPLIPADFVRLWSTSSFFPPLQGEG